MVFDIPIDIDSLEAALIETVRKMRGVAGCDRERSGNGLIELKLYNAAGPWGSITLRKLGDKTRFSIRDPRDGGQRWADYVSYVFKSLQAADIPFRPREQALYLGQKATQPARMAEPGAPSAILPPAQSGRPPSKDYDLAYAEIVRGRDFGDVYAEWLETPAAQDLVDPRKSLKNAIRDRKRKDRKR